MENNNFEQQSVEKINSNENSPLNILKRGQKIIYKQRRQEWSQLVDDYACGSPFAYSIRYAIDVMEAIENKDEFEEISRKTKNVTNENEFENMLSIVARFSKQGVAFFRSNKRPDLIETYFLSEIEKQNCLYEFQEKQEIEEQKAGQEQMEI